MTPAKQFAVGATAAAALSLAHAGLTWGPAAAVGFAAVAVAAAFVAERLVLSLGLLVHHTRPQLAGVPVWALLGWVGAFYVSYRVALLAVSPALAPLAAAGLATAADVAADPRGVADGLWSYPESRLSRPRYRGVPWWNFAGWLVLTATVSWATGALV
ncbi:MAG: carotenoid biosynthesis protein [Haloferacaceae archaeon]